MAISAAQMAYMLEGIDWRSPQLTWRPEGTILPRRSTTCSSAGRRSSYFSTMGVFVSPTTPRSGRCAGRFGLKVLAVLRLQPRRAARRCHKQPHRDGQDERRRPPGLARRRAQAHRLDELLPWNWIRSRRQRRPDKRLPIRQPSKLRSPRPTNRYVFSNCFAAKNPRHWAG